MKVLYFIAHTSPSAEELEDAEANFGQDEVNFRTAKYVRPEVEHLEEADKVTGAVPGSYMSALTGDNQPMYERVYTALHPAPQDAAEAPAPVQVAAPAMTAAEPPVAPAAVEWSPPAEDAASLAPAPAEPPHAEGE